MEDKNIFRILQTGSFARDQIRIEWQADFKPLPENLAAEISDYWENQRRPFLFNGQLARLDAWAANDEHFVLYLSRSDYRTLLYSNAHIRKIESEWGTDYFSRALGISAVLVTADEKIVLIRRSGEVGEFPNLFDVFGGHIDASSDGDAPCVFASMEQELDEEAGLAASDFKMELIGLIEAVPNRKPELVFLAKSELFFQNVLDKAASAKDRFEYSKIFALDRSHLEYFVQKNKSSFSPSAFGCLVVMSNYLQKKEIKGIVVDNVTDPLVTNSRENQESRTYSLPDVNRIAIAGVLQQDPPLRWTKKGVPVTNFIVATIPDQNGKIQTILGREECNVSVVVWAKQALQCKKYLRKGSSVLILGELQSMPNADPETGFYPIQVNAQWIQYLDKGTENKDFENDRF